MEHTGWAIPKKPYNPRHRRRKGKGSAELADIKSVGCLICRDKRNVEVCHVVPHAWGGTLHRGNLIPLCPTHHKGYDRNNLTEDEKHNLREGLLLTIQVESPCEQSDIFD